MFHDIILLTNFPNDVMFAVLSVLSRTQHEQKFECIASYKKIFFLLCIVNYTCLRIFTLLSLFALTINGSETLVYWP